MLFKTFFQQGWGRWGSMFPSQFNFKPNVKTKLTNPLKRIFVHNVSKMHWNQKTGSRINGEWEIMKILNEANTKEMKISALQRQGYYQSGLTMYIKT